MLVWVVLCEKHLQEWQNLFEAVDARTIGKHIFLYLDYLVI